MQTYSELVDQLPGIRDLGFVKTCRKGPTGIGKTLENLLGIKENNVAGPNGHFTELKSGRKNSASMLTLFTKSPLPPKINRNLVEKFGKPGSCGKKVLHTTIDAVSRNNLYGRPGFLIEMKDYDFPAPSGESVRRTKIEIGHKEYGDLPVPYWNQDDLEYAFIRKYPQNLLYVKADHMGRGDEERFHFNEAWLMSGFSFERFINLLKNGMIKVDIRLGQYPDGRLHDHGTGFRIMPDALDQCFSNRSQIL